MHCPRWRAVANPIIASYPSWACGERDTLCLVVVHVCACCCFRWGRVRVLLSPGLSIGTVRVWSCHMQGDSACLSSATIGVLHGAARDSGLSVQKQDRVVGVQDGDIDTKPCSCRAAAWVLAIQHLLPAPVPVPLPSRAPLHPSRVPGHCLLPGSSSLGVPRTSPWGASAPWQRCRPPRPLRCEGSSPRVRAAPLTHMHTHTSG